jgi:hypothetical protein
VIHILGCCADGPLEEEVRVEDRTRKVIEGDRNAIIDLTQRLIRVRTELAYALAGD